MCTRVSFALFCQRVSSRPAGSLLQHHGITPAERARMDLISTVRRTSVGQKNGSRPPPPRIVRYGTGRVRPESSGRDRRNRKGRTSTTAKIHHLPPAPSAAALRSLPNSLIFLYSPTLSHSPPPTPFSVSPGKQRAPGSKRAPGPSQMKGPCTPQFFYAPV